ncbi:MAG: FAD-binding oxidoreductase [Cellvibrionales bacterium]|nr:FAD-binding oxidoreductase [Cellvibrionales bacterium]
MNRPQIKPAISWVFNSRNAETQEKLLIDHPVYLAECASTKMISNNTLEVSFYISSDQGFDFNAGQYLALYFPKAEAAISQASKNNTPALYELPCFDNSTLLRRSYSIVSSPQEFDKTGKVSIAISLIDGGCGSTFFKTIKPGDLVFALGPFGNLNLDLSIRFERIFLLGTGTGIAPYLSMQEEIKGLWDKSVDIVAGFRSKTQAIYLDQLSSLNQYDHVTTEICFSREKLPTYHYGYIQHLLPLLMLNPKKDCFYLCGNPRMIDAVKNQLINEGFCLNKNLFEESYTFSGHLDDDYPFSISHLL